MNQEYFISFTRGFSILVKASCLSDAVILAKASAIRRGFAKPHIISIRHPEAKTEYFGNPAKENHDLIPGLALGESPF